jgi:hypothetical protein
MIIITIVVLVAVIEIIYYASCNDYDVNNYDDYTL